MWCVLGLDQHSHSTYYDNKPHKLGVGTLSTFTGDDVPFLRGADDDLSGINLLFAELMVSCQLRHCDAVTRQALRKLQKLFQDLICINKNNFHIKI